MCYIVYLPVMLNYLLNNKSDHKAKKTYFLYNMFSAVFWILSSGEA